MTFSEQWKDKFRAKGLIECRHCSGTGLEMTDAIAAALDLGNDGAIEMTVEDTFCKHCNGNGWVLPATSPRSNLVNETKPNEDAIDGKDESTTETGSE